MCQFAGYQQEDGSVVGDPAAVGITKVALDMCNNFTFSSLILVQFCERLGWRGKGTSFDFLPILLSGADGEPRYYDLPEHLCMKVSSRQF